MGKSIGTADFEAEKLRSDLQHQLCEFLHDRPHYAPVRSPRRVVQVGTGNGSWAIDFAERNPTSAVLGIDTHCLSPKRVVPDNCSFDIASAQGYWDFMDNHKADFIFQRFYLGGLQMDYRAVIGLMHDNLAAGGWVELHEWAIEFQSATATAGDGDTLDGDHQVHLDPLEGTALREWSRLIQQGLQTVGKSVLDAYEFAPQLRTLGFRHVTQRTIDVPVHTSCRDRHINALNLRNILLAVIPLSYAVLGGLLRWTPAVVKTLVAAVMADLEKEALRPYLSIVVVTAQKPHGEPNLLEDPRRATETAPTSTSTSTPSTCCSVAHARESSRALASASTSATSMRSSQSVSPMMTTPPGFQWGVRT